MATFSQQFLANLGRPAMTESLFGLGRTIGGLPGQAQDRRKREQFNQLMQQAQGAQGAGEEAHQVQACGVRHTVRCHGAQDRRDRRHLARGSPTGD